MSLVVSCWGISGIPSLLVREDQPRREEARGQRDGPEGLEWAINASSLCALSKQIQGPA